MSKDSTFYSDTEVELRHLLKHISFLTQKYKSLYDDSPDLLRTIDISGVVLDCNNSYAKHLGYSKKELIGKSIFEVTADKSMQQMRDSFETWKTTGHVKNRKVWLKRKDGTTFPVLISANNLFDEDGKLIGSNTVIRDISDHLTASKSIEKKLEFYKNLAEIHKIAGEADGMAEDYRNIGDTLKETEDYNEALDYFDKARQLDEKLGDKTRIAKDYYNLASSMELIGNPVTAEEYYEKAHSLIAEIKTNPKK